MSELPLCPVCCDTLGKYGGPVTLPCGHNGCMDCFHTVKTRNPQCPLCRAPFDQSQQLVCNHELRDLVALASSVHIDDSTKKDGWEAFPTSKMMSDHYASEFKQAHLQTADTTQVVPSAPLYSGTGFEGDADLLLLEPPHWLPDSYASGCGNCHQLFRPLARLRHHCRMCGKIFCNACCHKRLLLPPKYQQRDPQRACEMCSVLLLPLQGYLAGTLSRAVQPPIHDSMDNVSLRSWLNPPWSTSIEGDIYKCANLLRQYIMVNRLQPERGIPTAVLQGARGLALLSSLKVGAGWSCTFGTGLVVSRHSDGEWSAPCAISCFGLGWGLQVGGELTDVLLVLRTDEAVKAFCGSAHLGVGGNIGVAVGPVGRQAEASMRVGDSGHATVYSYSCSKGAFIGISIESTLTAVRHAVNNSFYGYPVTAGQLLLDRSVPQPPAAQLLYDGLHNLMYKYENRGRLVHTAARPGRASSSPPPVLVASSQQRMALTAPYAQ